MIDFEKLNAFLPPHKVSWRVGYIPKDQFDDKNGGKATALAYIDSRDVMNRLDEVCNPFGWQDTYPVIGTTTVCRISIWTGTAWVSKEDGAGTTDIEAEKGQLSDAFKRCAVKWGIGRYLYDLPTPWVAIDKRKQILPSELERLAGLLPNAHPNQVKVSGMHGLSKEPAKFWSQSKLIVTLPAKFKLDAEGKWPADAWEWWKAQFTQGINKAPSRDLLARYQADNQHILDQLPAEECHALCEACAIRAEQFDQQG